MNAHLRSAVRAESPNVSRSLHYSARRSTVAEGVLGVILFLFGIAAAANEPAAKNPSELTIAAVGDIMLGGTATPELEQFGYDYPFEHVREWLTKADVAFGNLEGPLTDRGEPATNKQFVFRSPPEKVAGALARAGIRVVSLANNHSMDYGTVGLSDTVRALDQAGIRYAGAGESLAAARRPAVIDVNGTRVAFLAYSLTFPPEFWATAKTPGTPFGHEDHVRADVAAARKRADVVIVSFHWGREGTTVLRDYQMLLGHAAIDAGASAVLGHHPHILQAVERYRDGVILYSLGNFVFGSYSEQATRSVIAMLSFRDRRLTRVQFVPINVKNAEVVFQPRPLTGADADEVVRTLQGLSSAQGTDLVSRQGMAVLDFDAAAKAMSSHKRAAP